MASVSELRCDIEADSAGIGPLVLDAVDEQIRLAQGGCTIALGELYQRCHRYLLLIANQEVSSQISAKLGASDIVQDTLLKAHRNFGQFEGTTEAELRAWLRAIVINCVRDANRRYQDCAQRDVKRERDLQAILSEHRDALRGPANDTPSKQIMAVEQASALRQALSRMSTEYRRVVVLRNFEHQSFAEIGVATDRSEAAARKLWLRAIDRLRELLEQKDESRGPA